LAKTVLKMCPISTNTVYSVILVTMLSTLSQQNQDNEIVSGFEKQFLASMGFQNKPVISKKLIRLSDNVLEEYFNKTGIKIVEKVKVLKKTERGLNYYV